MPGVCVEDTETIALSQTSATPQALVADLVISPDDGNAVEARANGVYAFGRPLVVGALPTPVDGLEVYYQPADDTSVQWHLRYSAGVGLWICIGGTPLYNGVAAAGTRAGGGSAYADAGGGGGTGPQVTIPLAGTWLISHGAVLGSGTDGSSVYQTIKLGAAAASDADSIQNGNTRVASLQRTMRRTGLSAGAVLAAKYRNASGTDANLSDRWLTAMPVAVT